MLHEICRSARRPISSSVGRGRIVGAIAALSILTIASPSEAQQSTTRGWNLGFMVHGASLEIEDGDADTGGGGGVWAGYGLNRNFTVFVAADASTIDAVNAPNVAGRWDMAHVDFGVRFRFANSLRRWIPFLEGALGARAVSVDDADVEEDIIDVSFSGASFTLGGGISYYLNETLALDVGVKLTSGEFTDIDVGPLSVSGLDIDAQSTRFGVGLSWWP